MMLRVAEDLNHALHALFERDHRAYLLGEDVADPYGGAFKVTRGLSTRFPGRVLSTPISEATIVGAASGLALAGNTAIAELMFGDFMTLAYDQLVNFASKSVSMYGQRTPLPLLVRCPVGGNRGYGPTHSQSLQKHLIGVPELSLYELSPLHPCADLLTYALDAGGPAVLFEDKVLYTRPVIRGGTVDSLLRFELVGPAPGMARVHAAVAPDCVLVAAGGTVHRVIDAMHALLLQHDVACELYVPGRLYPMDLAPVQEAVRAARVVCVVEESTAGGTWGAEVAHQIHTESFTWLRRPVRLVHSADSVIPAARHLEEQVLVQADTIRRAVLEELGV
jgi:pyruvate/2-oxoglutarate/acetoin dehydrogenase E1 component